MGKSKKKNRPQLTLAQRKAKLAPKPVWDELHDLHNSHVEILESSSGMAGLLREPEVAELIMSGGTDLMSQQSL